MEAHSEGGVHDIRASVMGSMVIPRNANMDMWIGFVIMYCINIAAMILMYGGYCGILFQLIKCGKYYS